MSNKEQQAASEAGEKARLKTREPKPMSGADFITSFGFIVFGTAMFITAYNMHTINIARNIMVRRVHLSSPGLFPMIIGVIFVLFGFFMLYRSYNRGGLIDAKRIISFDNIKSGVTSPISKKLSIVFLIVLSYVVLLGTPIPLPYVTAEQIHQLDYSVVFLGIPFRKYIIPFLYLSMGYLLLTLWYLKATKWYWMILISVVFPIAINALFTNFFRIPMP